MEVRGGGGTGVSGNDNMAPAIIYILVTLHSMQNG